MKASSTRTRRWTTALFTGLLVVGLTTIGQAEAGVVVDGNPTCEGFDFSHNVEDPTGTYVIDEHGLYMTLTIGTYFDVAAPNPDNAVTSYAVHASSDVTTGQIIVKGGDGAIIYQFGEATPLHAPALDNNDKWPTLSHVQVCWDEPETGPELGRVDITKVVTGDGAPTTTEFQICITGPEPDTTRQCETVTADGHAVFEQLDPGTYTVTEPDPGANWTVAYADDTIDVIADRTTTSTVTNTYEEQQQAPPVAPPTTPVTPPSTPVAPPTVSPSGGTVAPATQPEAADLPVTGPSIRMVLAQAGVATALLAVGTVLLRLGRRSEHWTG